MINLASDTPFGLVDMDVRGLKEEILICREFESSTPTPENMELFPWPQYSLLYDFTIFRTVSI
jgi:hypothetical protein